MFEPPLPMLAQLGRKLPKGAGWRYEPKLDGFRGVLWHGPTGIVRLLSRNHRDLGSHFPEIVQAGVALPNNTGLDGEIVIADVHGTVDFGALQARLSTPRKDLLRTARECPAVLVVFDVLEIDGQSLIDEPLTARRCQLERLLSALGEPCLQLMDQTDDVHLARDWLTLLPAVEGVVAKRADGRYCPGRRQQWIKVKRCRTADCIVIGIAGDLNKPKLVLGLYHADGEVHHLGRLEGVICHVQPGSRRRPSRLPF